MVRKYGVYTPEFKTQAISLVREANRPASEFARELGINTNTLYNCLSATTDKSPKKLSVDDYATENKRLTYKTRKKEKNDIFQYIETYYNLIRLNSANDFQAPIVFEKMNEISFNRFSSNLG